jgi:hypothetical protein
MYDDVLADLDLGHMLQTNALLDAAEIDLAHQHIVLAKAAGHFSWNSEAHRLLLNLEGHEDREVLRPT